MTFFWGLEILIICYCISKDNHSFFLNNNNCGKRAQLKWSHEPKVEVEMNGARISNDVSAGHN